MIPSVLVILLLLNQPQPDQDRQPVVLVELYTSQGCSSCPPADALLKRWQDRKDTRVILLAYHVAYWNYLGWSDPYSQEQFSERQRKQAQALGSRVYTPQMVIDGKTELVGSRVGRAETVLARALTEKDTASIHIQMQSEKDKISLTYRTWGLPAKGQIHLALVQDHNDTNVRSGENRGRKLHNTAVVRAYIHQGKRASGDVEFTVPDDTDPNQLRVVAWITDKPYGAVLGAMERSVDPG